MTILISLLVLAGGLIGVFFNRPLSNSMMKYQPEENRARMFIVGRIAYVLIGGWMIAISLWVLYRAL